MRLLIPDATLANPRQRRRKARLQPACAKRTRFRYPKITRVITAPSLPPMNMRPMGKERMLEGFGRREALIRVQRQAPLEQVDKVVELPALGVIHARRRGQEARTQVPRRLNACEGADVCLWRVVKLVRQTLVHRVMHMRKSG